MSKLPAPPRPQVVKLAPAAVQQIKAALDQNKGTHLYLSVHADGTDAYRYAMALQTEVNPADYVDLSYGFTFVVDSKSIRYLNGTVIDWEVSPTGDTGFRFHNPLSK